MREWFHRILFSATLGLVNEKSVDEEVLKIVDKLWYDRERFDRGRFMYEFDEWLGDCSRNRIKENISDVISDVISEFRAKKTDMRKIIDKILLVDDPEIKQEIMNAVRKRIM